MSVRSHEEYQENLGAYALGALPELEAEILERHLGGCESCSAELARLGTVASALARSVPQVEPPVSLKASLMRTVNQEAELRAAASRERPESRERRLPAWLGGIQPRMAAAGALAVLALGVIIGVTASQVSQNGSSSHTIAARIDRKLMPTGAASLDVSGDSRRATLKLTNAPPLPPGREYQMWIQRGKTIERGPAFKPGADGQVAQAVPGGVQGANAVLVTVERAGGAPAPTGPPIMQIPV